MDVEKYCVTVKKQMDKIIEAMNSGKSKDGSGEALDLLQSLALPSVSSKMSLQIMTKTKIGVSVNMLRKAKRLQDNEAIQGLAKSLIKAWKKLMDNQNGDKKDSSSKKEEPASKAKAGTSSSSSDSAKEKLKKVQDSLRKASQKPAATSDAIRVSCKGMLTKALRGEGELPNGLVKSPEDMAELIEDHIYQHFKNQPNDTKYKNQIRSRVFNLRDKKNPDLRLSVLCGTIKEEKIAFMTSQEMASDDVKRQRASYLKKGIDESRLAIKEGTHTDLLKCGKCLNNNVTYNQLQTRSADEPMTTFCLCNECGNRWKFC